MTARSSRLEKAVPIEPLTVRFTLEPVPPFRLDLTAWALRRRQHNAVDRWDGETYRRSLKLSYGFAEIEVRQFGLRDTPRLEVSVAAERVGCRIRPEVTAILRRMLGLDVNLQDFYRRAAGDHHLGPLADRFIGLKPPRFPTLFECLVNAIACQQLSLNVGIRLLNGLAGRYGRATVATGPLMQHAFPDAGDVAQADPDALRELGFSTAKARAVVELSRRVSEGTLDLDQLAGVDDDAASAVMQGLRGIGRWSAEYALLRGLGRLGVFPADDVGAQNNLQRLLGVDTNMDSKTVRTAVAPWAPYAGLVYFHLLLDRVDQAGWLTTPAVGATGDS